MKKYILCFLIGTLSVYNLTAQEDVEPFNTGAANFLLISPDARSAGIAGTGVALTGNSNAIFYNGATALLNETEKLSVGYTFIPWMRQYNSDFSLNTLSGFYKIDSKNAILGGIRYYNYPKTEVMLEDRISQKSIRPKELSAEIGYAREIFPELAVSATVRYIHSDMGSIGGAKKGNAVAFDIGALYKRNISAIDGANWAVGLNFSNLGTKIKYISTKESLPFMSKIGGSINLPFSDVHRVMVTTDLGYRFNPSDVSAFSVGAGAEYTLMQHFSLRGGYHYGDKEKADWSYATAGIGVNYYGFNLDFSWLFAESESLIRNTFWAGIGYSF